jgi:hypothetical protein
MWSKIDPPHFGHGAATSASAFRPLVSPETCISKANLLLFCSTSLFKTLKQMAMEDRSPIERNRVLIETPLAKWRHRNRYVTEQLIKNLFELPAAIEAQRRQNAIAKAHRDFIRFLKRKRRRWRFRSLSLSPAVTECDSKKHLASP